VRIISVVEPPAPIAAEAFVMVPPDYFAETEKALREAALGALMRTEAKFREGDVEIKLLVTTEVLTGSPKRVIVEEAEKWGADLMVVGSHGYRTWERLLLGSVSQAVSLHAECSVLIVREKKNQSGGAVREEK
jgi:nucleotide-binding universal stress UspA family protein